MPDRPPSRREVDERFVSLLVGTRTRDEVDRWAAQWVTGDDSVVRDEPVSWALMLLCGVDLRHGPEDPYLHDDEQVTGWLQEFRRRCSRDVQVPLLDDIEYDSRRWPRACLPARCCF